MNDERPLENYEQICPECGNVATCEMVDIGVGSQQLGPFMCEHCGWVQEQPEFPIIEQEGDF